MNSYYEGGKDEWSQGNHKM